MEERSVAIEVALNGDHKDIPDLEAKLDELRAAIAERGGVPLRARDGQRYGARFCVTAPEAGAAVDEGVRTLREASASVGLPDSPVVDVEASTLDELADAATEEVPQLIGVTELAELLGVGHHLVTLLVRAKGFPAPAAELNAGPVWTLDGVNRFLRRVRTDPDAAESSTRPG